MIDTPSELNKISEDELRAHVTAVMRNSSDPTQNLPLARAQFITADVMRRLHNILIETRLNNQNWGNWSKQAAFAKIVATFTGINLQREDAEYIGNAEFTYLRDFGKALAKAASAQRSLRYRALKSGRQVPDEFDHKITELKEQIFRCKFGGVPRNVIVPRGKPGLPILRQAVPVQRVEHADDANLHLQQRIIDLQEQKSHERDMMLNLQALCHAVDREHRAREDAERQAAERALALDDAAARAASEVQQLKKRIFMAEKETNNAKGQVLRLQSQLGNAYVDASHAAEREQQVRSEAALAAQKAASMREEAVLRASSEMERLKSRMSETVRESDKTKAQVHRLQALLGAAHVEAARAAEREQKVRGDAQLAARQAVIAQVEAVAKVTSQLQAFRDKAQRAERECKSTKGMIERLGAQLGGALIEAARATECAREATKSVEQLKELLRHQEAEAEEKMLHLRTLKAQMAKRARAADRRAAKADSYLAEVAELRMKLRRLRKDMNETRVQLNLEVECEDLDEEVDDDDENSSDNESTEAAVALQRMRSMPTWRAVRGKGAGKGEKKLEWGTRLTIYSLLSMMIPASAVGMAIVAIVKRTAPWLQPTAPTYETVKRCRFELRLVEEAIAGRRIAEAFRIRSIGFDETTKLGLTSLTSNVQIEPCEGAKFQDVVLRAAYCPLGGTAELIAKSIDAKCFSRLRDFLRRWKAMFETMFPCDAWTGPDPSRCSMHRLGGGGAIISDTCNTARKARELLAQEIAAQVQQHVGVDEWDAMTEDARKDAVRTHCVDCWQHIRNIFLAEMSSAMAKHVKTELQPELDTFSAWERMSTDFSQLLRASFKEFHHSCRYYKGQGRSYTVWLRETHPTSFAIHLERADGGRQEVFRSA